MVSGGEAHFFCRKTAADAAKNTNGGKSDTKPMAVVWLMLSMSRKYTPSTEAYCSTLAMAQFCVSPLPT